LKTKSRNNRVSKANNEAFSRSAQKRLTQTRQRPDRSISLSFSMERHNLPEERLAPETPAVRQSRLGAEAGLDFWLRMMDITKSAKKWTQLYGKRNFNKFVNTPRRNRSPFQRMADILLQTADNAWQAQR